MFIVKKYTKIKYIRIKITTNQVYACGGLCEHGNEPSGSIKGGEFLDWLSDC
jgi:hypothetical protein